MTTLRKLRAGLSMVQGHRMRAEAWRQTIEVEAWDEVIDAMEAVIACHEAEAVQQRRFVPTLHDGTEWCAPTRHVRFEHPLAQTLVSPL